MPTPLNPWVLALLVSLAACSAIAAEAAPEASQVDFCDPALDLPGLVADAKKNLEDTAPAHRRAGEASVMLLETGGELAAQQSGRRACDKVFKAARALFKDALSGNLRRLRREARVRASGDPEIAQVQATLSDRWLQDQAARLTYLAFLPAQASGGARSWALRLASAHAVGVDAQSTVVMRGLLDRFDWIDSHRFGSKTAGHAWLLVQHADHDPAFQQLALERMASHLDDDGVRPRHYAYLHDRVAVNTGKLQRYGTQPSAECNADGSLDLQPVEDPETLDERRRAMGLGPSAEQLAQDAAQRCR